MLNKIAIDLRPLADPAFRRLWLGHGVSFIGVQLTAVAVPVQVYELSRSSFWVGMVGAAGLVPLVAFALWGGASADAMDRRQLLFVGSAVTWIATLGLVAQALIGQGALAPIFALVIVQSVGFALSSPTRGAIIPRLVPVELVPAANTLMFTTSQLAFMTGPLLAQITLARYGFAATYALDAALFTVVLYAALRLPSLPPVVSAARGGIRAVIEGLSFLASRPVLLMSLVVDIIAMGLAFPRALFPEVAADRFGGPENVIGWLFSSIAIGAFAGGLVSGWIGRVRRQGVALTVAIVCWGLAVAAAGLAQQLWVMVTLLAVGGAADLISAVYRQTILQTYAPDEMRGRMQGVFIAVVQGGPRLGDLRAGATAGVVGATASWVGGGLLCVVAVLAVFLLVPSFRRYESRTPRAVRG